MNYEQKQTREFFDRLIKNETYTIGCWISLGVCTGILVMLYFLPAQEMLLDVKESVSLLLLMAVCGPAAAYFRILPYQAYGTQPNHQLMSELIKYHPVNRAEKKKMELFYSVRYMAKVTGICMLMQLSVTIFVYGKVSWINVVYVFVGAFVYPMLLNMFSIYFEK